MLFDWLFKLIEQGVKGLHSFILHQADKRWFLLLVIVLVVIFLGFLLMKVLSGGSFGGFLKVVAAIAGAIFLIKKMKL